MASDEEPRHGLADFLEGELPKLQAQWEAGEFSALIEAFVWCAGNGYRAPKWVTSAVLDELQWSMRNRPRGGTKLATAAARKSAEGVHQVRFLMVEQFLQWQRAEIDAGRRSALSEIEAARAARAYLVGMKHPAGAATPEAIRRSWKGRKAV